MVLPLEQHCNQNFYGPRRQRHETGKVSTGPRLQGSSPELASLEMYYTILP